MPAIAVWGIDIGQCALKAVKARAAGALVEVMAFDHIEYRQPLSTAGTDASATIREALQTFLSRNDVENCEFSVSIAAGRAALIRFIKLPPVDRRKVPDIVRYEAGQQIPFPLEDVIWDHQVIERNYAPGEELEVGIFAMRRESIFDFLSNLMVSGIEVANIQLAAVALYNCVHYDQPIEEGAIMAVDIGAENTNLVVVDGASVWTRSLPIGGNDFTRAIATKYNMDFEQAENLKRNMERSKKAQEIFEALRPSLRSLLDEIQRSAGYYRSLHKSAKFVKLVGFGSGFKMFGVRRFLEAGLAYPVEVFEKTNNIFVDSAVNQQFFKKSGPAFGAALGLVIQGLGLGGINTTLMPPTIIKERLLRKKRPFFIAAAALLASVFAWPALAAYTMPTEFDVSKTEVARSVNAKLADQKAYNGLIDVKGIKADITSMIDTKQRRIGQLEAFQALVASVPTDLDYPVYIQAIAMESGTQGMILGQLLKSEAEAENTQTEVFPGEPGVQKDPFINKATMSKEPVTKKKLSSEERETAMEDRMSRQERMRSERSARAAAAAAAGAAGTGAAVNVKGTKAKGVVLEFSGWAQMANLAVETGNPKGAEFFREMCKELKKQPGVLHCEMVLSSVEPYWEHIETFARLYSQPSGDMVTVYRKVDYTTAVIQWVYKRSAPAEVAEGAEAPEAEGAEAPEAEGAEAAASEE